MSGRVSVCSICPKENEQIDAVIRINKEEALSMELSLMKMEIQ